jgi:hypothetical protein
VTINDPLEVAGFGLACLMVLEIVEKFTGKKGTILGLSLEEHWLEELLVVLAVTPYPLVYLLLSIAHAP